MAPVGGAQAIDRMRGSVADGVRTGLSTAPREEVPEHTLSTY